jgi:hypothetical protein
VVRWEVNGIANKEEVIPKYQDEIITVKFKVRGFQILNFDIILNLGK